MSKQLVMDMQREAAWRKWVGGHLGSGLTIQKYCHQHGLAESAFYSWKAQFKRLKLQPGFVPVAISVPGPAPAVLGQVEILLAGGHRVWLSGAVDRQMLHDVVAVLEARPC